MQRDCKRHFVATAGRLVVTVIAAGTLTSAAPMVPYVDLATPFENVAIATGDQAESTRITTTRTTINALLPGVYPYGLATDKLIANALAEFPGRRVTYDRVIADFPAALNGAVTRFRTLFPDFTSPLPIYLYHSLGERDGGSDYLEPDNRHVMLFGADMIAKYHSDNSLQPFMDHELFHLQHERYFPDCDQFWCTLWQEGLAVDAAATMTPHATDHQLLLDIPGPIRPQTDARWGDALCFVAAHFDDTDNTTTQKALQMGGNPPRGLPDRFGYYVGLRLAQATKQTVPQLSRLDHKTARLVVRNALIKTIKNANAGCTSPAVDAAITHQAPHPV